MHVMPLTLRAAVASWLAFTGSSVAVVIPMVRRPRRPVYPLGVYPVRRRFRTVSRFGYGAGVAMPFVLIPLFMVTALLVIYRLRRGAWPPAGPALGLLSFAAVAVVAFFALSAVGAALVERLLLVRHYGVVAVAWDGLSVARRTRGGRAARRRATC